MMKLERPETPDFLKQNFKKWGKEFAARRRENPRFSFNWKAIKGKRVNELLREFLIRMTSCHCSFCDSYPSERIGETIEHFRPKDKYPLLAYVWHNLFLCCHICQSKKGNRFDRRILKPDARDYRFEKYFMLNYKTGEILPNKTASEADQERAQITIEIYGLNASGLPRYRIEEYRRYNDLPREKYQLDDFSYRFFLE